jgi:hypothetical protein
VNLVRRLGTVLLFLVGCDSSSPCTTCPPLAGTWVLQYQAAMSTGCEQTHFGALPATISIGQQQSVIDASLDGTAATGSLYDTYNFRLSGMGENNDGGFGRVVELRGVYIPAATPDAGDEHIEDGLFTRIQDACQEDTPFKATRQ